MLPVIHQSIALSAHITHGEYEGLWPSDCGAVFGAVSGRKATKSPARGIAKRDLSCIDARCPFFNPIGASAGGWGARAFLRGVIPDCGPPLPFTLTIVACSTGPPLSLQGLCLFTHLRLNASGLHRSDPFGMIGGNVSGDESHLRV